MLNVTKSLFPFSNNCHINNENVALVEPRIRYDKTNIVPFSVKLLCTSVQARDAAVEKVTQREFCLRLRMTS